MRRLGLFGCGGRRRARTTRKAAAKEQAVKVPDLVKGNFTPEAPDRLWVADITYVRSWGGLALPLVRAGHLLPKDSGLVHGEPFEG